LHAFENAFLLQRLEKAVRIGRPAAFDSATQLAAKGFGRLFDEDRQALRLQRVLALMQAQHKG
jgi:hypothetical protein